MSAPQLTFVKKFFEQYLKKIFIEASNASCSSLILLAKKPGEDIRFCIDYWKLISLPKKDAYSLPLIAKIMVSLKKTIISTKIAICQAFHKLQMASNLEDLTMFACQFDAYK